MRIAAHDASDARRLEMDGVSPALSNLRMEVRIAAVNTDASALRDLVRWAEARSPVGCTVRTAAQWDLRISTE
jgi:ribonuclease HI